MAYRLQSNDKSSIKLDYYHPYDLGITFSKKYLKSNALNLAILSALAYKNDKEIEKFFIDLKSRKNRLFDFIESENTKGPILYEIYSNKSHINLNKNSKLTQFIHDEDEPKPTHTQLFLLNTKSIILIAVRGSEKVVKDWQNNFKAKEVEHPDGFGQVHQGFLDCFNSVSKELIKYIKDNKEGKKIIVTGHSLGGAIATLIATHIRHHITDQVMLYTYGSPRVGDSEFVEHFTKKEPFPYYRFVNGNDLVTMVPPPYMEIEYPLVAALASRNTWLLADTLVDFDGKPFTHLGTKVYIKRYSKEEISVAFDPNFRHYIEVAKDRVEWKDFVNPKEILDFIKSPIADHSINNYISILASDLRNSIVAYMDSVDLQKKGTQKIIEKLEKEIAELRTEQLKLEYEIHLSPSPAPQDNTRVALPSMTKVQKIEVRKNATLDAVVQKSKEKEFHNVYLKTVSNPNYSKSVLKTITDAKMDGYLLKEFEYQRENIKY